jgi:hypothetical protein
MRGTVTQGLAFRRWVSGGMVGKEKCRRKDQKERSEGKIAHLKDPEDRTTTNIGPHQWNVVCCLWKDASRGVGMRSGLRCAITVSEPIRVNEPSLTNPP